MEQCSPHSWFYYNEEEGIVELRRFLAQTLELEATILSAQEEISRKEEEIIHMRDLLMAAIKERDEAQYKSQKLLLEKLSLEEQLQQQQQQTELLQQRQQQKTKNPSTRITSSNNVQKPPKLVVVGDTHNTTSISSSDNEGSIISDPLHSNLPTTPTSMPQLITTLGKRRPLPEKGKLLQAVMEAGPLLQTLMLAGPLPQWQHPPPQLDSIEIPPVTIPSSSSFPSPCPSPSPVKKPAGLLMQQDFIASTSCGNLVSNSSNDNKNRRGLVESFDGPISPPSSSKHRRVA